MARGILTPANVSRYLEWKHEHDRLERLCKSWHDGFIEALQEDRYWHQDGYSAMIREYQRSHFQHKLLLVEYPDIHEEFSTMLTIKSLIINGPSSNGSSPSSPTQLPPEMPRRFERVPQRKGTTPPFRKPSTSPGTDPLEPPSESLTAPGYIQYLIDKHLPSTEEMAS